jgi:hypothetical protein
MLRTILRPSDFTDQAAAILAASKARRADLRMELIDNDEGDGPDPGDEDDEEDDASDDADDKDDQKASKDKSSDEDEKVDRAEYERVKRHRAAADRRKAELETEVSTLKTENAALKAEGKDGKLDEATTARVTELQKTVDESSKTIQTLRINNAFLSANDFTWHDPEDAMRLADLSEVEIEEDGTVVGLKEALKKLAKAKPHLIKKAEVKDDADVDDEDKNPSGSATNGRRKGGRAKPDRAALSKTYPVLATRR